MMLGQTKVILAAIFLFTSVHTYSRVADNTTCGIIPGQPLDSGDFGPYDYTDPAHQRFRPIVEEAHFSEDVETLRGTNTIGEGMDYTLRKFPNHHRALYAMMRYQKREKDNLRRQSQLYTMDCYFKRALYFRPKDAIVHMLMAMNYHWNDDIDQSERKYKDALELKPNDPQINYNIGLLYYDKKDYDLAAKFAKVAYDAGYPLEGLRNKLKSVNVPTD